MIVNIDPSLIVNVALGFYFAIWGFKMTKAFLEWLITEYTKSKRRQ